MHVADTENYGDRQRQRHRESDERTEGDDVQRGHRPGVFVAKYLELLGDIALHFTEGCKLHHHQRADHDQRQRYPHVEHADAHGRRQVQIEAQTTDQESQAPQIKNLGKSRSSTAVVGRKRQQVVHAEPGRDHQRRQDRRPDKAGVLDKGGCTGGDLAEYPAAVLQQRHRLTGDRPEDPGGHHQRNQHLHGGDAEISQSGVQTQRGALQAFGEKTADIGHRTGEVAAADAGQERPKLEYMQRRGLVLQREAGTDRRNDQQCRGQKNGVASATETDEKRRGYAQRRAHQARDRGQCEQLCRLEGKAEVDHLHRDDAPHQPHGEPAQQIGYRYPQIAISDALAPGLPECFVLDIPFRDIHGTADERAITPC